ncbi:UNVERIFIED_CONTAM: hypothetical protein GTU68_036973, partial [Idotea baltica]|nr:hypothetical protein [Idotea baltica]
MSHLLRLSSIPQKINSTIIQNGCNSWFKINFLGSAQICANKDLLGTSKHSKHLHICSNGSQAEQQLNLTPQQSILILSRSTGFFNKLTAEQLWKGVTSVSNAGKKRGRGKGNRKIFTKNLNKGQYIGTGEENIVWPGLNAPVIRGKEIVKQQRLPKDENRMQKLLEMRDKMGLFRPLRLNPLERGWSGTKMPGRSIGPPDAIGEDNFNGFDTKVLELKTVTKMDGNLGRKRRIS